MVRMTVRNRIFAFILGLGTVVFFLFLGVASYKISQVLKENIGEDFHRLAQQMAAKIDLALRKEIDQWRVFAHNDALIEAVERANRRYEGLGPEVVRSEFERIDREWPFSEAYRHFYTPRLNSIARLLSRYQSLYPEGYAELFVTDGKGALIAATNRTTDYWQADEGWWQIAFSEGRGAVYVGDVEFDDSAQLYAVAVALPVKSRDGTRAVGVLKVILNFHELMGEFAGYRLDGTGHVHILNSRGLDLFESVGMPNRLHSPHKPGTYEDIRRLSVGHLVFKDARGEGFIAGFAPVVPPERLGPATFGGQQLYVLVEQNLEEAYASIYDLVKILLGLGTFVLVAIYMTARLTAKTITDPLDELRRGTQVVRDGDLAHRVELATGDELQELADSFNEMTARLQASYEVMEYRVRERTAELEQAVHALEGEITEREQAQKALGETRAFYERLVGEAGDAVVALDWDSALVTWNLGAEKIFGYKAHEVLGKHSGFMVPEEDLERAKAIRQAVLAGQTVRDEVVRRVGKDGVIIDGLATFSPLRNSEGQVVGLCTIFKDITERRRASEELERFALQQTAVAELGSLALRSGELQVLMDEAVRLAAEALGVEMCEILKLEDSGETLRLMAGVGWREGLVGWATVGTELESQAGYTLREGGPVIVEDLRSESRFSGPSLLRDHEVVSGLSVPMVAGDFVFGVMGVHAPRRQDFSEEDIRFLEVMANVVTTAILAKQAEEALRQAHAELEQTKQYLESLIESSTDAIIATDRDGKVVLFNKGAEALSGYRREEVIGLTVPVLYESGEDAKEVMRQIHEGSGKITAAEMNLRAKDGTLIPVLISASLLYDEEGQEAGTVGFSKDLRERTRAEEELRRAHEELQQAYQTLERAQASAIAAEKMASLGRLTAGVSHEILNPLNVITLHLHMLLTNPDTHPEMADDLRDVKEQADRIYKITQGLLHFARQRPPERRPVDLNETVKRTLSLVGHELKLENIGVELSLAEKLPPVSADQDQLQQVVLNLITNARDAMPDGGRLVLRTDLVQANGKQLVELLVEDTGGGVRPEHEDKLFDPFYTTKPEGEGTGLGLSICQGIIKAHGGTIWAENVAAGGAAFYIRLGVEEE